MADEFDQELDQGPEGSIITPIFLGCGAMGLGCLFSLGAIVAGVAILFPGLISLVGDVSDNPMREPALLMAEADPAVIAAIGTPIEAEINDIDEGPNMDGVNIEIGDVFELSASYNIVGPIGAGRMEVVGSRLLATGSSWEIISLIVVPAGSEPIRIFPGEGDTPPPPAQLTPPDPDAMPDGSDQSVPAEEAFEDAVEEAVESVLDPETPDEPTDN